MEEKTSSELMEEVCRTLWQEILDGVDEEDTKEKIEIATKLQNAIIDDKKTEYDFSERYNKRIQDSELAEKDRELEAEKLKLETEKLNFEKTKFKTEVSVKEKDTKTDRFNRYADWGIKVGTGLIGLAVSCKQLNLLKYGLVFEFKENGSISSPVLRNLMSKNTPKLPG